MSKLSKMEIENVQTQSIWTASKRKDFHIELFRSPLISLKLLIRSATQLSSTNYWLYVFRLALSTGPGTFCQTEEQRSSSVTLEAARFESDAVSLRVPSLAQPSSFYMSTTALRPSL